VGEYNATTGAAIADFTLHDPVGLAISGNDLYVSNYEDNTVDEYNATTGAAIAGFTSITGLDGPADVAVSAVPEPRTWASVIVALGGLLLLRRRSPRNMNRLNLAAIACVGLLAFAAGVINAQAQFTPITLGNTVSVPTVTTTTDPELSGLTLVATSGVQNVEDVRDESSVFRQTNGTLDFFYQFFHNGGGIIVGVGPFIDFNVPGVTLAVGQTSQSNLELFATGGIPAAEAQFDSRSGFISV
jgi:hypothetical protein